MADQLAFENIKFDKISYPEIADILADHSSARMEELKSAIAPVYDSGIEFDNIYYLNLDDLSDFDALEDKSYVFKYLKKYGEELSSSNGTNGNDIIIVFSHKFDDKAENLYQRAYDLNWVMIADENMNDDSPLVFMYVFTQKQTAVYKVIEAKLLEILKDSGLVPAEDQQTSKYGEGMTDSDKMKYLQSDGNTILYYVAYCVMGEKSIEAMENMIISLASYINTIEDIAYIRSVIAEKKQCTEDRIYIFSFSIMGHPLGQEEPDDNYNYQDEVADNNLNTPNKMNNDISVYVNRITYRINGGEEKIYDSYQNIDLSSDEASKYHLAESVIVEEENLSEEDAASIEIISVELLGSYNDYDYEEKDDDDDDEVES